MNPEHCAACGDEKPEDDSGWDYGTSPTGDPVWLCPDCQDFEGGPDYRNIQ